MAKLIERDYGIQPNERKANESFVDFTEKTTWFYAMTKALQRHSEFMRPDLADNYRDMEYAYPPPFVPDTPLENRTIEELTPTGQGCVITCFSPLYCDEPVQCHMSIHQCPPGVGWVDCQSAQAYQYWINGLSLSTVGSTFNPDRVYPLEIGPPVSGWPEPPDSLTVNVQGTDAVGNVCETSLKVFCRDRDLCCEDPAYSAPVIDDDPNTVAPGGSLTVTVAGGCSTYNWQVSGTGWSWSSNSTSVGSNTLNLADTDCGEHGATATVVVTDACGNSDTATFRSTAGGWYRAEYSDGLGCAGMDACLADSSSGCRSAGAEWSQMSGAEKWCTRLPYCVNEDHPMCWDIAPPCGGPPSCAAASGGSMSCSPNGDPYCQPPHTPDCQHRIAEKCVWACTGTACGCA